MHHHLDLILVFINVRCCGDVKLPAETRWIFIALLLLFMVVVVVVVVAGVNWAF